MGEPTGEDAGTAARLGIELDEALVESLSDG